MSSDPDGDLMTVLLKMPAAECKFIFCRASLPTPCVGANFYWGEPETLSSFRAPRCVRWQYSYRPEKARTPAVSLAMQFVAAARQIRLVRRPHLCVRFDPNQCNWPARSPCIAITEMRMPLSGKTPPLVRTFGQRDDASVWMKPPFTSLAWTFATMIVFLVSKPKTAFRMSTSLGRRYRQVHAAGDNGAPGLGTRQWFRPH
jgi:hypothetical protein